MHTTTHCYHIDYLFMGLYFHLNNMDDEEFYLMKSFANNDDLDEEARFDLATVASFILAGVSARQQEQAERRRMHCLYLLWPHLMPCP